MKEHVRHKLRHVVWIRVDEGTKSEDSGVAQLEGLEGSGVRRVAVCPLLPDSRFGLQLKLLLQTASIFRQAGSYI